jgi:fibronectin-binding autotransporter adhesin
MRSTLRKAWLLAVALALSVSVSAQTRVNPVTGINWPQSTGSGAPSGGLCTALTRGQPYTDVTGNNSYVCGSSGWFQANNGGGGGGNVASVFGRTGTVVAVSGDYSVDQVSGAASLVSPAFTGSPTAPTPGTCASSTAIATAAYVATCAAAPGSGVTQLLAGSNITLSPSGGTGVVTINAASADSTAFSALTGSTNTTAAMVVGSGASLGATGSGAINATSAPYAGLTGSVPTWNQSTTGTAANITATTNATLTTLSALQLPYSQLSGSVPTWNQNTTGTASNLSGTPTLPNGTKATTQTTGDVTADVATDMFVSNAITAGGFLTTSSAASVYAPLASPHLTGAPTAPTGSCASSTAIATQAYVATCATPSGGVTQLLAGANITLSPTNGLGAVTITASSTASLAFSAITGSTNTGAAMVIGSGASMAATGSGTIAATSAATVPATGITGSTLPAGVTTASGLVNVAGGALNTAAFQPASAFTAAGTACPLTGCTLEALAVALPTTSSAVPLSVLQASLVAGGSTSVVLGTADSTNNAGDLQFVNIGVGSSSNVLDIGLIGDPQLSISTTGALSLPSTLTINNPATNNNNTLSIVSAAASSTNSFVSLTPSIATGGFNGIYLGTAPSTNNGVEMVFNNVGGGGSASNTFTMGLLGEPAVTISSSALLTVPGGIFSAGNTAISTGGELGLTVTNTSTATGTNIVSLNPNLAVGGISALAVGTAFSTGNGALLEFNNVGGAGSSANTVALGVINRPPITVDSSGNVSVPGTLTAGSTVTAPLVQATTTGTTNTAPILITAASLGVGSTTGIAGGLGLATNNDFDVLFENVGGSGASTNVMQLGIVNEPQIVVNAQGSMAIPGGLNVSGVTNVSDGLVVSGQVNLDSSINAGVTIDNGGTGSAFTINSVQPGLATGDSTLWSLGTALSTNNGAEFAFNNIGGAGSASNTMSIGVTNDPGITIAASGNVTVAGALSAASYGGTASTMPTTCSAGSVGTNPSPTSSSNVLWLCYPANTFTFINPTGGGGVTAPLTLTDTGTTNTIPLTMLSPDLGTGTPTNFILGVSVTTGNAGNFKFNNSGTGSSSNNVSLGVLGDPLITISTLGGLNVPGQLTGTTAAFSGITSVEDLQINSGTTTGGDILSATAPSISIGDSVEMTMGVAGSAFNSYALSFNYAGLGSADNSMSIGMLFEPSVLITSTGSILSPSSISAALGFAGSGTTTITVGGGAGSGGSATCTLNHVCDQFSGNITLTTGTSPATGANVVVVGFPNVRASQPNCTINALDSSLSTIAPVNTLWANVNTGELVFVSSTALAASSTFQLTYVCGGV